jgi:hypothetical protein
LTNIAGKFISLFLEFGNLIWLGRRAWNTIREWL